MILNVSFIGALQLRMAKWSINSGNEQELSLWQPDVDTTQQSTAAPQSTNLQICDATNPQGIRKKYFINANQSIRKVDHAKLFCHPIQVLAHLIDIWVV